MTSKEDRWEKENESKRQKVISTDAYKKRWEYLVRLTDEPSFQQRVARFRKKYGLPSKGLAEIIWVPSRYGGKEKLVSYPEPFNNNEFREEMFVFGDSLGLDFIWAEHLCDYIVYNRYITGGIGTPLEVFDLDHTLNGPFSEEFEGEEDELLDYIKSVAKDYPVAVLIDPYTPERDIVDFVKNNT